MDIHFTHFSIEMDRFPCEHRHMRAFIRLTALILLIATQAHAANKITFDESGVLEMNGKKMFVVSFAVIPLGFCRLALA